MSDSVFKYLDYKDYLKSCLSEKGRRGAFSKFVGCQPSFLSQVLNGKPDLSLEHGLLANEFLEHTKPEAKFFLLLLQFGRATSQRLRDHFQTEIKSSLEERSRLSKRVDPLAKELSEYARSIYYSSWVFSAAHVLCSIDSIDQAKFLAKHLGINNDELFGVIQFLMSEGLLKKVGDRLLPSERRIHLPASDPLVLSHHRNFRIRALEEMKSRKNESLHYSILMAISKKDSEAVREIILKFVEDLDRIVAPSREEAAYQLNLDFFET